MYGLSKKTKDFFLNSLKDIINFIYIVLLSTTEALLTTKFGTILQKFSSTA